MAPKKSKSDQPAQAKTDVVETAPKYDGEHVIATDDANCMVGIFGRAGDDGGTIRYPNGRTVFKPIALIRLAEHHLASIDTDNEDVDVVTGDLVYCVNDADRIIGVFYAASQPGYGKIHYPGNRFEQIPLDDVRAARLPAETDGDPMFPRDADSSGNGVPDDVDFDDDLDAAADRVLREVGEPDLAADQALDDEMDDILNRPESLGEFVRRRFLNGDGLADADITDEELMALAEEDDVVIEREADADINDTELADADLPPADGEELPPGEPQSLPEDFGHDAPILRAEARKPLTPEQFGSDDDSDLYAVAVRLQNAGLLTGATRLHKALPSAMPHDVTITCVDEDEYDQILKALPKHLAIVAADRQTRTLIVHEAWLDEGKPENIRVRLVRDILDMHGIRYSRVNSWPPEGYRDVAIWPPTNGVFDADNLPDELILIGQIDNLIIVRPDPYFTPIGDVLSGKRQSLNDDDPQVSLLQKQLAEATAEVNRLRDEVHRLRAVAADDAEAEAAMDAAQRNIRSMTLVFSDVEKTTGDRKIAELTAAGWWLVPSSEHFLVRRNAFGTEVIAHALRFEYTINAPKPVQRITEDMLLAVDLPLVEDEPTDGLVIPVKSESEVLS